MAVEVSESMLSPSQSLCAWAGNCQLLLDKAAPNDTFCEEEKNGAVIKQNLVIRNRKWVYAEDEGGVIWAQAEEHSAQLINSGLDSCMWIESSLSLRAKQKDKWQSTSLEREKGIAQLVLRWVASFIRRGRCSKCLAPWRKGWFRAGWGFLHWPSVLEQIWWHHSKFLIICGINYLRKRKMVKT